MRSSETPAPMPIVVGVGRSGTTLLRLMLDSHPELAVPPETGFLPRLQHERETLDAAGLVELLTSAPTWPDFHLDPSALRTELDRSPSFSVREGARSFYRLYARRFGKARWGDKTPVYCRHMPAIQELLPEARFIHLIRDGRDVAVSLRPLWFAPSREVADLAAHWQEWIANARHAGASCRHYLEVRYEELIADPASTLRRICDFVELAFATEMLDYPSRAAARIGEVRDQQQPGFVVTREQRLRQHPFVGHAPRLDRVGRWRHELTPDEVRDFEAVAGELLVTLGYERAS